MTAAFGVGPNTAIPLDHIHALVSGALVAGLEEVEHDLGGGRSPNLKGGFIPVDDGTQIIAVVGVVFNKVLAIKNRGGNHCLFAVALNYHAVAFANIKGFFHFNNAAGNLSAHIADVENGQFLVTLINLDLLVAGDRSLGGYVVLDLVEIGHARKGKFLNHGKRFASVLAGVLCCITALEVDKGFFALNHSKTVFAGCVLGCFSPRGATGLGASGTNDKSDLLNAYGHVEHDLCTVVTGVHDVAAAFLAIPPSPNVTVFNNTGVRPIEGDLIVALFLRDGVFSLGNLPLVGGRVLPRGGGAGIALGRAGAQHGRKHHCNEQKRKNARVSLFHDFTSYYFF